MDWLVTLLSHDWIIALAVALYVIGFVADKVPVVDSASLEAFQASSAADRIRVAADFIGRVPAATEVLAVGAARRRVHLSYSRIEQTEARPRVPSFPAGDRACADGGHARAAADGARGGGCGRCAPGVARAR